MEFGGSHKDIKVYIYGIIMFTRIVCRVKLRKTGGGNSDDEYERYMKRLNQRKQIVASLNKSYYSILENLYHHEVSTLNIHNVITRTTGQPSRVSWCEYENLFIVMLHDCPVASFADYDEICVRLNEKKLGWAFVDQVTKKDENVYQIVLESTWDSNRRIEWDI